MTDDEYQEIVSGAYAGTLLIGIDREVAWRVFMKVPLLKIGEATGERPYVEKF